MARLKPHQTLARLNAEPGAISKDAFAEYPAGTLAGNSREEMLKNKLGAVSGRSGYTYLRRAFTDPVRLLMGLSVWLFSWRARTWLHCFWRAARCGSASSWCAARWVPRARG
jgi:hypothetical protein